MKRSVFLCLLALVLLLTSCAQSQTQPQTQPQPQHLCETRCNICDLCADLACREEPCGNKCYGHREKVYPFPAGDYITSAEEHIDTGTLVFDLGEHIYVRGNLAQLAEKSASAIETITGMDFDAPGFARTVFPDGKLHVNLSWEQVKNGTGFPLSDLGDAWTGFEDHVYLSPGDLFVGNGCVLVHELCHRLQFCQSGWFHSPLLNEGFAEYTTYLVLQDMEQNDPAMLLALGGANQLLVSLDISDDDEIYGQPLENWLRRKYGNHNYTIGFRFMAYLHHVYGDYTRWISAYESAYPYWDKTSDSDVAPVHQEIAVLQAVYGADVLDGFYPWLQEHEAMFTPASPSPTNVQGVSGANWYPVFGMEGSMAELTGLQYQDLYLNLDAMRHYLTTYKGLDSSDLKLILSEAALVYLYRADGSYTAVCTADPIDLDGIAYIKLVGQGYLDSIKVDGSFCMRHTP